MVSLASNAYPLNTSPDLPSAHTRRKALAGPISLRRIRINPAGSLGDYRAAVLSYTINAGLRAVFAAHELYLPKPKLAVEDPGGVQASFDFQGAKNDAAGRMLTVTLTNDLDRTHYA